MLQAERARPTAMLPFSSQMGQGARRRLESNVFGREYRRRNRIGTLVEWQKISLYEHKISSPRQERSVADSLPNEGKENFRTLREVSDEAPAPTQANKIANSKDVPIERQNQTLPFVHPNEICSEEFVT